MNHYQTTTDKVLALILPRPAQTEMVGGIVMPPNFDLARLHKTAIAEMTVHSVGPDCKTVRPGDRCLYNKNHISPLPCQDGELIVLPEGQIICVVKEVAPKPETIPLAVKTAEPQLTVEEIRASLRGEEKMAPEPAEPTNAEPEKAPA